MIERWSVHPSIRIGLAILALALAIFFLALTGPIRDLSDSYLLQDRSNR